MIFPYRTHISFTKIKELFNEKLDDNILNQKLKPIGFYYSFKDEWYNFLNNEMNYKKQIKYIYELKLNSNLFININDKPDINKILLIKNIDNIDIFIKKYCSNKEIYKININKLQNSYGGIEIHNPHKLALQIIKIKYNFNSMVEYLNSQYSINLNNKNNNKNNYKYYNFIIFLDVLDVSGGCIWNTDLIKYIKLINKTK
jgi:hypothetical protein